MKLLISIFLTFLFALCAFGQTAPKVFIAPMEDNFNTFITAAVIEEKVPVIVVTDDSQADFVITGGAVKGDNKWYDTVFGGNRDRNQGTIQVLRVSDKSVAWAGAAGDKSFWWGSLKSGGQKKVASRLARKLKKDLFNKKFAMGSMSNQ